MAAKAICGGSRSRLRHQRQQPRSGSLGVGLQGAFTVAPGDQAAQREGDLQRYSAERQRQPPGQMPEGQRQRDAHAAATATVIATSSDASASSRRGPPRGQRRSRAAMRRPSQATGCSALGGSPKSRVEQTGQQHRRGGQGPGLDQGASPHGGREASEALPDRQLVYDCRRTPTTPVWQGRHMDDIPTSIPGVTVTIAETAVRVASERPLTILSSAIVGGGVTEARDIVNMHVDDVAPTRVPKTTCARSRRVWASRRPSSV